MLEIKATRQNLKQEHIDFYRPVCHKQILDDLQGDTASAHKRD